MFVKIAIYYVQLFEGMLLTYYTNGLSETVDVILSVEFIIRYTLTVASKILADDSSSIIYKHYICISFFYNYVLTFIRINMIKIGIFIALADICVTHTAHDAMINEKLIKAYNSFLSTLKQGIKLLHVAHQPDINPIIFN